MSEASVTQVDGLETVILREGASEVHVVTGLGANVCRFRVGDGDVLAAPPDMATLRERPTRWGSACLFPFPGRIQGGRFSFRGREIQLPVDSRDGNAIHGVVRTRPWRVVRADSLVQARISTAEAAIPAAEWPWPFELTLTVSLNDGALGVHTEVRNVGGEAMPFGLGFHPYFHVDDQTVVQIEATEEWAQEAGLPTGHIRHLGADDWPRRPLPIGEVPPDSQMAEGPVRNRLLRRRETADEGVRATLRYPDRVVTLTASGAFRRMVFFTPASPPLVSLEPQTCVPNAHRLAGEGNADTGLVVLEAGQSWQGGWELRSVPSRG